MRYLVLAVFILATLPLPSTARTWFVEKDGSGDFSIIQDALDAAASGDTVRIGEGRFEDVRPYTYPGGDYLIIANVEVGDMTIIGVGRETTILGPEEEMWEEVDPAPIGILYIRQQPYNRLVIRDLSVVNTRTGLYVENSGSVDVERVDFAGGWDGIRSYESCRVVDCSFTNHRFNGCIVDGAAGVEILRSTCVASTYGSNWILVQYCSGVEIRDCQLTSTMYPTGGIMFANSVGGVYSCTLTGMGIQFDNPNGAELIGNRITASTCVIMSSEGIIARDNILQSGTGPVFDYHAQGVAHSITNNHILRGSGLAVNLRGDFYAPDNYHVDMTGNWWGTDDPALIAEWIWDGSDTVGPPLTTVIDFEPFLDTPVANEEKSFGGLKALFR